MKTILQFAFAKVARLDTGTLRQIWDMIESSVSGLERAPGMTGAQKLQYVLDRIGSLIPQDRKEIGTQIIRAIVEIVLIGIRLKGGAK